MSSTPGGRPDPQFTRHVDGVWPELMDLFAAGEAVADLLGHPGWAHVKRLLDAEALVVAAGMGERLLESRSEYAFRHGRLGGLRTINTAADAIVRRAEQRQLEQAAKHEDPVGAGSGGQR